MTQRSYKIIETEMYEAKNKYMRACQQGDRQEDVMPLKQNYELLLAELKACRKEGDAA